MSAPLVVVAVREEAAYLDDVVVTGPGKVSAAVTVASAIAQRRPPFVLNVGTAGALRDGLDGTHVVGRVLEHDFDRDGIEKLLGIPLPGPIELDATSPVTLATGDRFVQDEATRARLSARADLVDMEGYAVARACTAFGVACRMVKVVSDDATERALQSWQERADWAARRIADVVRDVLAGG